MKMRPVFALLLIIFTSKPTETTADPFYNMLKALGFQKEYRICDAKTFQAFFRVICRSHRPTPRVDKMASQNDNKFLHVKDAQNFLKSKRGDQNFLDECCHRARKQKEGCNVNEIYDYCQHIPTWSNYK